jgi:hypothetical protein
MPNTATTLTSEGDTYGNPFIGPVNHTMTVRLDVSGLTNDEVDANGYIKPGTPLLSTGLLVSAPAQVVYGVVIEPIKVAAGNAAGDLSGATDIDIAIGTIGQVNRDIVEDNLGRVLTADEIAGFDLAGSHLKLSAT